MFRKKVTEREIVERLYGKWLCNRSGNVVRFITEKTGIPAQRVREILLGRTQHD